MSNDIAALEGNPDDSRPGDRTADVYELDGADIDTEALARDIIHVMWDLKALNPVAIDLRGLVSYTDFVIICTGTSDRHVRALGKRVEKELKEANWSPLSIEGVEQGRWAVLDFGDVVVHVFNGEERDAYDLEGKWVDADRLEFEDRPQELYGHFHEQRFDS